jgi:hypothetical protein
MRARHVSIYLLRRFVRMLPPPVQTAADTVPGATHVLKDRQETGGVFSQGVCG